MQGFSASIAAGLLLAAGCSRADPAPDGGYAAGIEKWRQDFDHDVRTGGWLTLVGRYKLEEGEAAIGSDPKLAMVVPDAPARLGVLRRHDRSIQFEPAPGAALTLDGKAITAAAELSTKPPTGRVRAGDIDFAVRTLGEDFYVLVLNDQNPAIKSFKGTTWYPIDPGYRVTATFLPYAQPEKVAVPMTRVDSRDVLTSSGDVQFQLAGKTLRLKTFVDEDNLFVMFEDATNGKETYGGGRFLYAPLPKDGVTELDFNKAFNPYCSVNFYVICPVPPAENRLPIRVAAGETFTNQH
jgi:uncharacterized protein (DUF1684 family)